MDPGVGGADEQRFVEVETRPLTSDPKLNQRLSFMPDLGGRLLNPRVSLDCLVPIK